MLPGSGCPVRPPCDVTRGLTAELNLKKKQNFSELKAAMDKSGEFFFQDLSKAERIKTV